MYFYIIILSSSAVCAASLTSSSCDALKTVAGAAPALQAGGTPGDGVTRGRGGSPPYFHLLESPPRSRSPHSSWHRVHHAEGPERHRGNLGKPKCIFSSCDLWLGGPSPWFTFWKQNFSLFIFFYTFWISLSAYNYRLNPPKSELCLSKWFKYILARSHCRAEESGSIFWQAET